MENEPEQFKEIVSFLGPGIFAQNGILGTIFFVFLFFFHCM